MPHAARFVDGRKVGHSGSQSEEEIAESRGNWWSRVAEGYQRGQRNQRIRGSEDQRIRAPEDQRIRGSGESEESGGWRGKYTCSMQVLH